MSAKEIMSIQLIPFTGALGKADQKATWGGEVQLREQSPTLCICFNSTCTFNGRSYYHKVMSAILAFCPHLFHLQTLLVIHT